MKNSKAKIYLIILIFCSLIPAESFAVDTENLLEQAERAFKEGNELLESDSKAAEAAYYKAAGYYNSIIDSGVKNAGLYYNAANTWVRLGRIGSAILNYRRALLYSPNDSQIKYNLEYARSLQKNGFETKVENEVLHILFFWHYRIPVLVKVIILIASNLVFWGTLILSRFGRPMRKAALISLIITAAFGCSLIIDMRSSQKLHGVVTAEETVGRLGDSRSYESAFDAPLYEGVEFTVEQRRVGWLLVRLPNNELVWLEEAACGIIEE